MCLGIPMQVLQCQDSKARCTDGAQEHWVDISLVGVQEVGSWLLVYLGAAREVLDPYRAKQIRNALRAVAAVMAGEETDLDGLFADLAEREPQLPEHLQPNYKN